MHRAVACLLLVSAIATAAAAQQQQPSPADLAQALQKKYAGIKDFSDDFVHTYRGGVLKKQITENGHLLIKKPGKMRRDYTSPSAKQCVSDGTKIYSNIPADKQVMVGTVPQDDTASTPALFLTGKGDLTRDFTASFGDVPPSTPTGTRALRLAPRTPHSDYHWLVMLVDPASLPLRGTGPRASRRWSS